MEWSGLCIIMLLHQKLKLTLKTKFNNQSKEIQKITINLLLMNRTEY